ncbi:hypothetical protein HNP38_002227 [Chryseobacterium defluvii]|uniref:Uncharacterized protein n=1 Tax=Chryseobacterium defluvii TaxID=160396 RepID=A0A840KC02_9FLAO|nr:hypothetical protein [Chryseobacterium defluvii]MBB4806931.1 hypothetical protein [Chryseobacterium defluvii]
MKDYDAIPDFDDFDIENQNILKSYYKSKSILDFSALKGLNSTKLNDIKLNTSFSEISNEIALSGPFGKNSVFYKPDVNDYDPITQNFYTGSINYDLLITDLKSNLNRIKNFLFDFSKYTLDNKINSSGSNSLNVPITSSLKYDKPFVFHNDDNEIQISFDTGKLNERKNLLSNQYTYGIYYNNNKVAYNINFIYKDGEDKSFQDLESNSSESPTDFKLNDEYVAIKLFTSDVNVYLAFIGYIFSLKEAESMKKNVIRYFNYFFSRAENNSDALDGLYENIPEFVLESIPETQLWADLMILSESGIDTIGTNENIAIINLLKGLKNTVWFSNINNNPEPIRKIFKKFNREYIQELILIFSRMGLRNWKKENLDNAWKFDLNYEEIDFSTTTKLRYTGFAYYLEKERKYKIGTAMFGYDNEESFVMPYHENEIGPDDFKLPFDPMKMVLEDGKELYIPCFVAEYFTDRKIDEEFWSVLNNIAVGLLVETEIYLLLRSLKRIKTNNKIINKFKKFPRISNKFPKEELPLDGKIYGIVEVENGLLKLDGNIIPKYSKVDFVIDLDGNLILGYKHHLLGNRSDVIAAGTLKIDKGRVTSITNFSGHYWPSVIETDNFPLIFKELGVDLKRTYLTTGFISENKIWKEVAKKIK